jgi:hypothetical protein
MAARMSDAKAKAAVVLRDAAGAPWEKRGNTAWIACPACDTWFPASPVMLRPDAAPACCPRCHEQFKVAAQSPQ